MSGTSLDGLDIAYCKFFKRNKLWHYEILNGETFSYSENLKIRLQNAINLNAIELYKLDVELGKLFYDFSSKFIKKYNIQKIDFFASHGHTVFHQPENKITVQIGTPYFISNNLKKPVVYDFRTADVINGGQGAPLVPVGDYILFNDYDYCLNLGGFSNITVLNQKSIIAFDISPCNVLLNYYSNKLGYPYDKDGSLSLKGNVNQNLLKALNELQYYLVKPPKSLGIEWVQNEVLPLIKKHPLSNEDILATLVEHIGFQIGKILILKKTKTLVTGGGVFNKTLIKKIKQHSNAAIIIPDKNTINFKEAMIFAFLGLLRILGQPNCLKSVTGGKNDLCVGSLINTNNEINKIE